MQLLHAPTGCLQRITRVFLFSELTPTALCTCSYDCSFRLHLNYAFTHLSSLLDGDLLEEEGIVLLWSAPVLHRVLGTQKTVI